MRTLTNSYSVARPAKGKRRPKSAHEIAPLLVPQAQKNRADFSLPPALLAATIEGMADHERAVIDAALAILRARLRMPGGYANSPRAAHALAILHFAQHEREGFCVMFLDSQTGVIAIEELFRGTLTQTSVYPREVVRAALRHNAASVILMHNHPSGAPNPSAADKFLTKALQSALALVDVQTHDHLIVAGDRVTSFAEQGLL